MSQLNKTETDVEPSSYDSGKTAAPTWSITWELSTVFLQFPWVQCVFFFFVFFPRCMHCPNLISTAPHCILADYYLTTSGVINRTIQQYE